MTATTVICNDPARAAGAAAVADAVWIDDVCAQPQRLDELEGVERLVLALHRGAYVPADVQRHIRSVGADPIGTPIVHLDDAAGDASRLSVFVAGARAAVAASAGAGPDQMKPVIPPQISRRSLLTIPRPAYEPVPRIDRTTCVAGEGCRVCADRCPRDAYHAADGEMVFDDDACVSCGRCVTACPVGAVEHPTVSPAGVRSQIVAMRDAASGPIGIAFTCSRRTHPIVDDGWFAVDVPCASMVPGTWLLAALIVGARAATALRCSDTGCPLGYDDVVTANVGFARALLGASGLDESVVPEAPSPLTGLPEMLLSEIGDPFAVDTAADVATAIVEHRGGHAVVVSHPASPLGIVDIDARACTMCTKCATVCPTGALHMASDDGKLELSFDARSCTACRQCERVCPEFDHGAIHVDPRVDTVWFEQGRRIVNTAAVRSCEVCGKPVAPAAMLDRIASLLGTEHAATMEYVGRRCIDCRGS